MADIVCRMADCKHRSKRPLRKWVSKKNKGEKLYGCALQCITIARIFDMDGDIEAVAGYENMAHCAFYEPIEAALGGGGDGA